MVPAPPEIYTLSLHDALPICSSPRERSTSLGSPCGSRSTGSRVSTPGCRTPSWRGSAAIRWSRPAPSRSEEHTSELQSRLHLVCRLLLEKKKKQDKKKESAYL